MVGDKQSGKSDDTNSEKELGKNVRGTAIELKPEDRQDLPPSSQPIYTPLTREQESRYLQRANSAEPMGLYGVSREQREKEAVAIFRKLDRGSKGAISDDDINKSLGDHNLTNRELQWILAIRDGKDKIKSLDPRDGSSDITARDFGKFIQLIDSTNRPRFVNASAFDSGLKPVEEQKLVEKFNGQMVYFGLTDAAHADERIWGSHKNAIDAIHPEAIKQTALGTCYLSAALKAIAATEPELISSMIKDNKDGTYTVTFPGAPNEPITVAQPTRAEMSLANKGSEYGSWPIVLLKAYGQYRQANMWRRFVYGVSSSSFDAEGAGKGGQPADAFSLLTGRAGEAISVERDGRAAIIDKLSKAFGNEKNIPVVASSLPGNSDQDRTPDGYYRSHAYTVTGFDPAGPGGGTITLRNPWASIDKGEKMSVDEFLRNFSEIAYPVDKGDSTCSYSTEERYAYLGGEAALTLIPTLKAGVIISNLAWRYTLWGTPKTFAAMTAGESVVSVGTMSLAVMLQDKLERNCISSKYGTAKSSNVRRSVVDIPLYAP